MITEQDLLSELNQQAKLARRRSILFWILCALLALIILVHWIRPAHAQIGTFDPRSDDYADGSCP